MKYFIPKLEPVGQFEVENEPSEKLGGLPFGLLPERYPMCRKCSVPMALLAQFRHDDDRLNLGKAGRVLFVFQCNNRGFFGGCNTADQDSGANACFIIEPENLTGKVENLPEGNLKPEKEYRITNWQEFDDRISPEESSVFFDDDKYYDLDEETIERLLENVEEKTRLGGVPRWIQSPEIPEGNWRFAGQLDDITGFNFGDAGIGYIFIEEVKELSQLPRGKFFWQCY